MPEFLTKKVEVTFKQNVLPMGTHATFTFDRELWIAVPAIKYSAILGLTDHLIAIHHKIANDMVRWMNQYPDDVDRAGQILKRVSVAFESHRNMLRDKTKWRVRMIDNILDGTTAFMKLGGQMDTPAKFEGDFYDEARNFRFGLLQEEFNEYTKGEEDSDLVEVVDGLLDVIVVAWGTLLTYIGEDKAKAAAKEVVRSNLSKVDGTLGPIVRREDGKLMKPEGWTAPDIAAAIGLT